MNSKQCTDSVPNQVATLTAKSSGLEYLKCSMTPPQPIQSPSAPVTKNEGPGKRNV